MLSLGRDKTTCIGGGAPARDWPDRQLLPSRFPRYKARSSSALGLGRCCACAAETPPPSPGKSWMGGGGLAPSAKRRSKEARPNGAPWPLDPQAVKGCPRGDPEAPWTQSLEPPGPPEPSAGWGRRLLSCPLSRRSRGERGERKGRGGAGCDPAQAEPQGPCCCG